MVSLPLSLCQAQVTPLRFGPKFWLLVAIGIPSPGVNSHLLNHILIAQLPLI